MARGLGELLFRPNAAIIVHYHIDAVEDAEEALDNLLAQYDRYGAEYRFEVLPDNAIEIHLTASGGEVVSQLEESARRIARASTTDTATVVFDELEYGRTATNDVQTMTADPTQAAATIQAHRAEATQQVQDPVVALQPSYLVGTKRPIWLYVITIGGLAALGAFGYALWKSR